MIELRWLVIRKHDPVLQYRTRMNAGFPWSEWKDVPTEWVF